MTADAPLSPRRANRKRDRHYHGIIAAAEQEFVRKGYGGASVQAIADRAGLPKANIHYYFGHKNNLYRCVMERALALWCQQLERLDPKADPATALERYIRQGAALAAAYPDACRLLLVELLQGSPQLNGDLSDRLRPMFAAERSALQTWIAEGRVVAADAGQILMMIWSAVQITPLLGEQLLDCSDSMSAEIAGAGQLRDILLRALLPTPAEP